MRKWVILTAAILITLILDQLSKGWVLANLDLYESIQPIPFLAPVFQITRSTNTGAAFGILPMAGNVFPILAIIITGFMLWYFRSIPATARLLPIAIGMVIGGAFGNVVDRLQYGLVIDFIHYQIPGLISNVSNIADHGVVLGVLIIIADSWWHERREKQLEQQTAVESAETMTGQSVSEKAAPSDSGID